MGGFARATVVVHSDLRSRRVHKKNSRSQGSIFAKFQTNVQTWWLARTLVAAAARRMSVLVNIFVVRQEDFDRTSWQKRAVAGREETVPSTPLIRRRFHVQGPWSTHARR